METGKGAVVLAVEAGLIAVEDIEPAGFVGHFAAGVGGEIGGVGGFGRGVPLFGNFGADAGLLHAPETHLTPAADGHVFEELKFDGGGGLKFAVEFVEQFVETIEGFAIENDGASEEAVPGSVAGGDLFSVVGDGAAGFRSVGARGGLPEVGSGGFLVNHFGFILALGLGAGWVVCGVDGLFSVG